MKKLRLKLEKGFPDSSVCKESTCNAGNPSSTSGSGSTPGEGIGYPLQYSQASLVAPIVKNLPAAWKTWIWSLGLEERLEEDMATHSSILAWRIPWTEEPSRLQSMGSQGVGHDWATKHTRTCKYMNQFTVRLKLAQYFKSSIVQ